MINLLKTKNPFPLTGGILCFLFFFLQACQEPLVFEQNVEIKQQTWSTSDVKEFIVPITDNQSTYQLFLNSRHGIHYPLSNLALSIQEISPSQKEKTYLVTFQLAEKDGRWIGKGTGNLFNNRILFSENHRFADTGTYQYKIKPVMNLNPLPGIFNIGLRVKKTHKR